MYATVLTGDEVVASVGSHRWRPLPSLGPMPARILEAMTLPTACGKAGWSVRPIARLLVVSRAAFQCPSPHVVQKRECDAGRLAAKVPTIEHQTSAALNPSLRSRRGQVT